MQYYTFQLDKPSHELFLFIIPFGKYKYKCLPMGLKCTPDFVFHDIEDTGVYLDDISAFSFTWEHNMLLLDKILHQLEANGFTINPLKYKWAIEETEWLGYWLTPTHLKPWHKKIDDILQMQKPKNLLKCAIFSVVSINTDVASTCSHSCTSLQQVGEEDLLLDS